MWLDGVDEDLAKAILGVEIEVVWGKGRPKLTWEQQMNMAACG